MHQEGISPASHHDGGGGGGGGSDACTSRGSLLQVIMMVVEVVVVVVVVDQMHARSPAHLPLHPFTHPIHPPHPPTTHRDHFLAPVSAENIGPEPSGHGLVRSLLGIVGSILLPRMWQTDPRDKTPGYPPQVPEEAMDSQCSSARAMRPSKVFRR